MGRKVDTEVFAGQLMAQNMLIEILMGQIVLTAPDRGAAVRGALALSVSVIRNNPNLTESEKFGAGKDAVPRSGVAGAYRHRDVRRGPA